MSEESMSCWEERVAEAMANGAIVFQKNNLPIVCMRSDGALLEHEHADHPDYKFPVEVEFVGERPDTFHDQCARKDKRPVHYGGRCKVTWDHVKSIAFCEACRVVLTQAEQVHILSFSVAEVEASMYEPHDEALIYSDGSIAVTLHECCYTMWHRRGGAFLHGPDWSKKWKLTEGAREKIWGKEKAGDGI
jgi:hypothetical protein